MHKLENCHRVHINAKFVYLLCLIITEMCSSRRKLETFLDSFNLNSLISILHNFAAVHGPRSLCANETFLLV